jgi:lysophospholipase L1-like esterase
VAASPDGLKHQPAGVERVRDSRRYHRADSVDLGHACVAAAPDWCIVMAGLNDLFATAPPVLPATTIANLKSIYQALISAGIYVIALPIRVTGAFPQTPPSPPVPVMSATQQAQQAYINTWIKNFCATTAGITYVDVNLPFIDYSVTGIATSVAHYAYLTATDQVHDTPEGAMVTAQAVQSFLNTIVPARDDRFTLLGDVFSATNNPTGNLIPNGLMTGINGTLGNEAQGYVPSGWHGDGNNGGANAVAIFNPTTPYPNCPA